MNAIDNLRTLDRQIKDLSDWFYQTRSVPNYVKAQMTEVRATLKLLWEDIDPSAFGEGQHCGTVMLARHRPPTPGSPLPLSSPAGQPRRQPKRHFA